MKNSFSSNSFESHNIIHPEQKFCPWDGYKFNENETECQVCGHSRCNMKVLKFLKN